MQPIVVATIVAIVVARSLPGSTCSGIRTNLAALVACRRPSRSWRTFLLGSACAPLGMFVSIWYGGAAGRTCVSSWCHVYSVRHAHVLSAAGLVLRRYTAGCVQGVGPASAQEIIRHRKLGAPTTVTEILKEANLFSKASRDDEAPHRLDVGVGVLRVVFVLRWSFSWSFGGVFVLRWSFSWSFWWSCWWSFWWSFGGVVGGVFAIHSTKQVPYSSSSG